MRKICLFLVLIVFLASCNKVKNAKTQEQDIQEQDIQEQWYINHLNRIKPLFDEIPPIPKSIMDIINSNKDNWHISHIEYHLSEFNAGTTSIAWALEWAIGSGNEQLVAEIIKHYKQYHGSWEDIPIIYAKGSNINIVRMLLESGIKTTDEFGLDEKAFNSILSQFAYFNDDPAVLQLLIDNGARVNTEEFIPRITGYSKEKYYYSSVFHAAKAGKPESLRVLIKNGGNVHCTNGYQNETPLFAAAEAGSAECVKILLDEGAGSQLETINDYMGWTPLLAAAKSGNAECVELLLKAGANPLAVGKYGDLALRNAVLSENERSVELLLKTNAVQTINTISEYRQTSALLEAARRENVRIVRLLIDYGADVNMRNGEIDYFADNEFAWAASFSRGFYNDERSFTPGGQTALMFASTLECVEVLLANGADVNAFDNAGRNALLFQCNFAEDSRVISRLINAGSYMYKDKDGGNTLMHLAKSNEITAILKTAGCIYDRTVEPLYDFDSVDTR